MSAQDNHRASTDTYLDHSKMPVPYNLAAMLKDLADVLAEARFKAISMPPATAPSGAPSPAAATTSS